MLTKLFVRVGLATVITMVLASCGDDKPSAAGNPNSVFVLSAIPDEKITDQQAKFGKLAEYLAEKLGVKTEFQFSKDYADAVTKFRNGEVHLVWFGGLSGVQARMAVDGAEAIAQGKADPQYKSYFIANVKTGLETSAVFPAAIRERTFTFGSPGSTSGRLMPEFFILQNTEKAAEDWFKTKPSFQMSGGHVATANAVADGTYETGALNYKTYDSLVESDQHIRENTRIIWTTPYYADYNFTIHPDAKTDFGADFFEKVQKALIEAPAGSDALNAINREAIIPAKSPDFDGIRDVAVQVGLIKE
ncbi:MAG: phosphonate transport system substrate-binding protein [Verrucomicrobiales bacterium]|jgi:phosphonate transport system substrate-binding protein